MGSNSKDEVSASSDPQESGHASSNSEDEISAPSAPKGRATPRPTPRTRFPPRPTPRRGFQLVRSHRKGSASSDPRGSDSVSPGPWESDLLPDKSSGPGVGPEPLQPLRHGGARPGARLGRVLMRLAVASGYAGRLTSPIASTGQHYATNSPPEHHPMSVNWRMASVRGPFDHSFRSDRMEDKNGARRPHVCCSGQ